MAALIERVVFRRNPGVTSCLAELAFLIAERSDAISSSQADLLIASLAPWLDASILPIPDGVTGDFSEAERPALRVRLGMLAGALSIWRMRFAREAPEPAALARWRDLCGSDSLPEVRRAFEFAADLNLVEAV